jgi:hypothetical protein
MELTMTEQVQDVLSETKQQYLTEFFQKYADLIQFVNSLPINLQFKQNAVTRFDEGMFWVREGIINIQPTAPLSDETEPTEPPEAETEKETETTE